MELVVYTALFGPQAKPLVEPRWSDPAVPMVCFTDQDLHSPHWQITRMPTEPDPARANRRLKLLSHLTVASEWSLYLDSDFVLLTDPRTLLTLGDFVTHHHRFRTRISDEIKEIIRCRKADLELITAQVAEYQRQGFDTPSNPQRALGENGVLLRHHTPEVRALNEAWWAEVQRHSHRDQLSLDFCAWQANFTLSYWPGTVANSPHFYCQELVRRPRPVRVSPLIHRRAQFYRYAPDRQ